MIITAQIYKKHPCKQILTGMLGAKNLRILTVRTVRISILLYIPE